MRSVPHRVVCLLGLDDGVFPRKAPRDGDDLMLDDPHVGERDARTEDRQQLLDALMAATDRLIVTYTGNDERTNLAAAAGGAGGGAARRGRAHRARRASRSSSAIRCSRSTSATSSRARSSPAGVWSFDRVTLRGARALGGERAGPGPFLAGPLPALDVGADRARRPRALRGAAGAGVPAPAARHHRRRLLRRGAGRARRSSWTGSGPGASASACSTRASRARSRDAAALAEIAPRHAPAGRARPAGDRAGAADRRGDRRAPAGRRRRVARREGRAAATAAR